ncbi:MAG: HAMP domain-containing histidine kinase [Nitriliruptoraceae bacterium]|nr:HAMP domain-containing histidine kinase [Nitriliruptoraceae bacterium]
MVGHTGEGPPIHRRVWALIAAQSVIACVALVATLALTAAPFGTAPPGGAVIGVVAMALVLGGLQWLPPVYLEFRDQNISIGPTDGAYAVVLLLVGPVGAVIAVVAAEVLSWVRGATSPLKQAFNLTSITGGAIAGALVFSAIGSTAPDDGRTFVGLALALTAITTWDVAANALVVRITTGAPWREVTGPMLVSQLLPLPVSIALGFIAVILLERSWLALTLLVPVLLLVHVTATTALRQRTERQRIQQLAGSAGALVALGDRPDALRRIADQARELMTGVSAVSATIAPDGTRLATRVDPAGVQTLDDTVVDAVLRLGDADPAVTAASVRSDTLEPRLRAVLPTSVSTIWAQSRDAAGRRLLVLVVRDLVADGGDAHRADVLSTFVAQAAVTLANSELHDSLRAALEEQRVLSERKDQFIAAVSHELRTPLTAIGGTVETLRARGELLPAGAREQLLDSAITNTRRLRARIEDLLLVATRGTAPAPGREAMIDVRDLIEELTASLQPWARDHLQVAGDLPLAIPCGDREALRQILFHLLDNARKFGGPSAATLTVDAERERTRFAVHDEGPGIRSEERELLFEPFVQGDGSSTRPQGGLGLGLALCRQLASALGSTLELDADACVGTTFVLTVPNAGAGRGP